MGTRRGATARCDRSPLASRSPAAFVRYVGHPKEMRRLGARTHGRHPRRLRTSDIPHLCDAKAQMEQPRGQYNPLKEWLALCVLVSYSVQSKLGTADGKTAYARQFEKPYESLFRHLSLWRDPTLQPAKLRSSSGYGLWLGRSQIGNAHLIGTRVGIVVARTIRRLLTSEREESSLVVAMWSTTRGRTAS